MNMEKINVNSMDYRKLSKEDKLKVVRFKINKLLSDTSSSKAYEYYNGKKVGVPKDKLGIFKDLCEREKSLSKYVTISEEPVMERPTIKAEVVDEKKKTSSKNINEMDLEEINNRIKYIKKYLYEMTNLYKKDEYKNAKIIKIQGYDSNSAYIPYSKLGDYKTLYKYLKLLEMKKRELESIEVKLTEISNDKKEDSYEYLTEDDNPYETGYMQFTTSYTAKKDTPVVESTSVKSNDTTSVKSNNECKELMVIDNKDNKKEKTGFGKKILGFLAGTAIIGGICKGAKWVGNKFKNGFNKVKNETKEVSEILRKNKVKTAICAWIVAAAAVVCSFLPKSQSKKHKPDDIVKPTSVVETTEPSTKKDDIIIDEPVIEEPTEVVTENKEYNLGESVNIKDNSYIYTNSYDATDSTNKCTPYYNGSYDREVMGVTYELDGNLYTIYRDDMNASEKVNELISKGAKQTAVLVVRSDLVNTGDYEGYYNIDSIKRVRTR
ncbi:MAG TPA: hypothetical protein DHV54_00305 [Firmicutes bacterium]|nr:hypothetical protein [Bacillota bacterium]